MHKKIELQKLVAVGLAFFLPVSSLASCNSRSSENTEQDIQAKSTDKENSQIIEFKEKEHKVAPDKTTIILDVTDPEKQRQEKFENLKTQIENLPETYDPYITEPSPEAEQIFSELQELGAFSETTDIQTKRNPALKEYFIRLLLDSPATGAESVDYDPFPQYEMKYFSQWDQRWGFGEYADYYFGLSACGPTVMSMVYTYLTGEQMDPQEMADFAAYYGYAISNNGTATAFMTDGAELLGLKAETLDWTKEAMDSALAAGKPIILHVGEGEFTTGGHFIIVHGSDENGDYLVYDPFTISNNYKSFSFDRLAPQLKGIYAYSY